MYDFRVLKDQLDLLQENLGSRGHDVPWEIVQKLSEQRRALITQVEDLRRQLKLGSDDVAKRKREKLPTDETTTVLRELGDRIQALDEQLRDAEEQLQAQALRIPNLPQASVPKGSDASDNVEMRRWGTVPTFEFTPRSHDELGETLGILDFERASKLAGARFSLSIGLGAKLERALANFMLEMHTQEHGYTEVLPPFMVNRAAMTGTGQLPKFEDDAFHLVSEDYFLIPTAEVPVTNLYQHEILSETDLPIRYVAHTPCFRREAGSYGQDTKGLIRVHQFNKVELVNFSHPEHSNDALEDLTESAAEKVLASTGASLSRHDTVYVGIMGFSAAKTYDLEVWIPSQQTYREVSSCSNFEAFQARRASIRYRPKQGKGTTSVHTLNGSGLADRTYRRRNLRKLSTTRRWIGENSRCVLQPLHAGTEDINSSMGNTESIHQKISDPIMNNHLACQLYCIGFTILPSIPWVAPSTWMTRSSKIVSSGTHQGIYLGLPLSQSKTWPLYRGRTIYSAKANYGQCLPQPNGATCQKFGSLRSFET